MRARAFVHMARPLAEKTQQDKLLTKQAAEAEKLKRKVPQRVSCRHIFLRDMMLEAKQGLQDGEKLPHSTRMVLVSKHAEMFQRLGAAPHFTQTWSNIPPGVGGGGGVEILHKSLTSILSAAPVTGQAPTTMTNTYSTNTLWFVSEYCSRIGR